MKKLVPIAGALAAALAFSYLAINGLNRRPSLTDTFNRIYATGRWATDATGKGTSGSGSTLEITREYRAYIEDFIKKHAVNSVIDVGCWDWDSPVGLFSPHPPWRARPRNRVPRKPFFRPST